MPGYSINITTALLWIVVWFAAMLFYTCLDVAVWRKLSPAHAGTFNIIAIALCVFVFLGCLWRAGYRIAIFSHVTITGVLLALSCSVLFFVILDKGLDAFFEKIFPQSERQYQETVRTLLKSPVAGFLQTCVIAPFVEEILMRGFVLGGLRSTYGTLTALLVSSVLFALLHFNMVQTLSAFVCGMLLGLLYLKTNSLLCCMIAHCGYNMISYAVMLRPYLSGKTK